MTTLVGRQSCRIWEIVDSFDDIAPHSKYSGKNAIEQRKNVLKMSNVCQLVVE